MLERTHRLAMVVAAAAAIGIVSAGPTFAFGTYNSPSILGQQAEHERITRSLAEVGIEPGTLDLIAGKQGKLGGVGSPDFLDNSKGLGPAFKHCDNGDYLELDGYKQTRSQADASLRECFTYFEQLLDAAVTKAGGLVDANGKVNVKEAAADYSICSFPFDMNKSAGSAKCAVVNHFGRALHIAEDFWSHTNWADVADPGQPISAKNPPGLGRTDIPALVRYPGASSAPIPDGLISGCDDSVPVLGPLECRGRVSHSVLAKDNGTIDPANCESASPTNKYARAKIIGDSGDSNFVLAVCGAMRQAQQTWADFSDAVIATYGADRGRRIIDVIAQDVVPATEDSGTASGTDDTSNSTDGTDSSDSMSAAVEPAPSDAAADDTSTDTNRMAAGADGDAIDAAPAAESSGAMTWLLWLGIAIAIAAVVWLAITRRPRQSNGS